MRFLQCKLIPFLIFAYADFTTSECPSTVSYAAANDPCIHFVVEASISVKNGPEEYIVKDVIKNKFLKATNLDGSLYDAVNGANDATLFRGIGKPGAGKPVVILDDDDERGLVGMDDRGDISGTSMDSKHDHERNVGIRKSLRRYGH